MRWPILQVPFLPAAGMALFPFILVKEKRFKNHKSLVLHEKIHLIQQLELLILPFYILYLLNYLVNLYRYRSHKRAYEEIAFEKEAYSNDLDQKYLSRRPFWHWLKYL
ncbi:hypothetical protein [Desertivirga xinjiangensis]|uniref:hypothetical protein n=1 Tax=Desertivirga xinjiangensis TaxID=539206 RepID=UPI002108E32C|nr:hypothetical protein [Pedobacter xinjiangensis]